MTARELESAPRVDDDPPAAEPTVPWLLTTNDRTFLRSVRIRAD